MAAPEIKRVVFLGLPGAGKGTQAARYSELKSIAHISTGDMLRVAVKSGSELGVRVKDVMDSGRLVSDELMIEIIESRVQESDSALGYILDGFPRTVPQAEALSAMLASRGEALQAVIFFDLSEEEVMKRLAGRREAEGRADDTEETQRERIRVYREQTAPLIEFYTGRGLLKTVDASGSMEEVQKRLVEALS